MLANIFYRFALLLALSFTSLSLNAAVSIIPTTVGAFQLGNAQMGEFTDLASTSRPNGSRFQTLYASSLFPNSGPIYITQIAYRPKSGSTFSLHIPNYTMTLSTTSKLDDGLDNTFANNIGPDATLVASGSLEFASQGVVDGKSNFDIVFNLDKPFLYDPTKGNLLVDVQYFGQGIGTAAPIDAVDSFNDGASRVRTNPGLENCGIDANSLTGCSLNGNRADTSRAPVTQISYQSPYAVFAPLILPTSAQISMAAFVLLPTRPNGQRIQTLYDSKIFGGSSASPIWIRELAFRPALGQSSFSLNVPDLVMTMSTTPLLDDNLSNTFSNNVGNDSTVVLKGPIELSSAGSPPEGGSGNFDLTFRLSKPFLYDPSQGSLLVDMQFSGQTTGVGGYIDGMDSFGDGVSRVRTNGDPACGANDNNSPVGCSAENDPSGNPINKSRAQMTRFLVNSTSLKDYSSQEITTTTGLVTIQPVNSDGSVPVTLIGTTTVEGATNISSMTNPPPPPSNMVSCTPSVNLQISPEMVFYGDSTVCISPDQLGASCPGQPTLWHWDGTKWTQLKPATNGLRGQICGVTTSFSPFAFFIYPQQITFDSLLDISIDADKFPSSSKIRATSSSLLAVTFSTLTPDVCTVDASTVTILHYGDCSIAANQMGDKIYPPAEQITRSFAVRLNQKITFPTILDANVYSSISLSASTSSSQALTFTSLTNSVCSVTNGVVSLLATGKCILQANQAGDATYAAASIVQSFNVTVAPVSGNNDAGDVPLPSWAYGLLALILIRCNVLATKHKNNYN